jgi:hypothetical protein
MECFETCRTYSKLPFLRSTHPWPKTSIGESSPIRMGALVHDFKDERTFFVAAMWCDAPESMIHASGEELIAIKACTLPRVSGAFSLSFMAFSGMQSPRLFC